MKKIGLIVFVVALIVGVVVANFVSWGKATGEVFNLSFKVGREKGSGRMAAEVRDVRDFTAIDVSSVIEVEVTAQRDFHVEVEADDNLLQYISTEVRNGELRIELDKRVKTSNPLRVRISAPTIERVEASGASKVRVNDVSSPQFELDANGASKIELAGSTGQLIVDVSGASNVIAADLKAVNATVDASGASRVLVNVVDTLRSDASGASTITYTGTPASVQKRTSGASSVTQS